MISAFRVGSWFVLGWAMLLSPLAATAQATSESIPYLQLSKPQRILEEPQAWEGDQQPHTLSVVELNRGGYRYWGYYGLNNGRGTGLARSNDLVHWVKYEKNPLWINARWTSVLAHADPKHPNRLYYAITRDYDFLKSHIVLASSEDGIHLKQIKDLVKVHGAPRICNQNPNLFRDPVSGKFVLTFYGGNNQDYFDLISKSASRIEDLDRANEKVIMHETATVAAPTLMYLQNGLGPGKGLYYLVTEVYPNRYSETQSGEWQVKVFYSNQVDGPFLPVSNNPVQTGERACLFQHIFNGRFYGFQSHLEHPSEKWVMELVTAPLDPLVHHASLPYLELSSPRRILTEAQAWEGDQQPHTLSVVERNEDGHRYWGYYGLNEGRGTGLAFSDDLVHWNKYEKNPLWENARWTSVLNHADPDHPTRLHFAITRDYDTPQSHIVLATSDNGIHLQEIKTLVKARSAPNNRNQNPNLFRDPVSGKFVLTYYSGNDNDHFEIFARTADRMEDLDVAPDQLLLQDSSILAAPTMLYLQKAPDQTEGIYYLVTEVCPRVGTTVQWQVKVFCSRKLEGPYEPVFDNPVQVGDRACLFQHVFNHRYYGFQSHRLATQPMDRWEMEVIEAPLP